jgi:ribosomal protein S18 acetylase RimI-like enzyme
MSEMINGSSGRSGRSLSALSALSTRTATEADFPVVMEMYELLNAYFYQMGYHLPHPENVGQVWLDSFRKTLGRFSNVFLAEMPVCADAGDRSDSAIVSNASASAFRIAGFMLCRLKRVPAYMSGVIVGELSDMWIIPEARRMGLGDKLSRLAIDWLRSQGAHSIEIQVLRDNEASWKLYDRMGFQLEYRVGRLLWEDYDRYLDAPPPEAPHPEDAPLPDKANS